MVDAGEFRKQQCSVVVSTKESGNFGNIETILMIQNGTWKLSLKYLDIILNLNYE